MAIKSRNRGDRRERTWFGTYIHVVRDRSHRRTLLGSVQEKRPFYRTHWYGVSTEEVSWEQIANLLRSQVLRYHRRKNLPSSGNLENAIVGVTVLSSYGGSREYPGRLFGNPGEMHFKTVVSSGRGCQNLKTCLQTGRLSRRNRENNKTLRDNLHTCIDISEAPAGGENSSSIPLGPR